MKPISSVIQRRRDQQRPLEPGWRRELYDIIFEADTPSGRAFDIILLIAILVSIVIVALETVQEFQYRRALVVGESILTFFFTFEYFVRLACVRRPLKYATSFWGVIDLLSFLPFYLDHFIDGSRSLIILRSIRLLRVFRVLKLWRMMDEANELSMAVWRARDKIIVFLCVVLVAVTISGTLMYHVESLGPFGFPRDEPIASQFTSIPQSMYWAIVTMTTVGYGDVVPQTILGKIIAATLILLGYSLIIVPSTFVSAEIMKPSAASSSNNLDCENCGIKDNRPDGVYCYRCGSKL